MSTFLPVALGLLLQSTVLIALGLLALHLVRRHGPALQSLIGRAMLTAIALLLIVSAPLSRVVPALWHVSEPTPAQAPAPPEAGRVDGGDTGGSNSRMQTANAMATANNQADRNAAMETGEASKTGEASSTPPLRDAAALSSLAGRTPVTEERGNKEVGFLWPLGVCALLLWLALCQYYLLRLRRTGSALTSGPAFEVLAGLTSRPPQLLTHPAIRSPFLAGLRCPVIYLPTDYETEFGPTSLRAILAHELAHRDRSDNAWTLIARLLCAALWFQPLLWILCRRLEQISEEACDLAVLAHHCPPRAYVECLLTLAERHPLGRRERALGAGVAPFRSSLGQRITRILDKGTPTMSAVSTPLRLVIAAGAIAAVLGGALLVSCAPAQTHPGTPQKVSLPPQIAQVPVMTHPHSATLAFLDAQIKSTQERRLKSIQKLTDFPRASNLLPKQKLRIAALTRNFSVDNDMLKLLLQARKKAALPRKVSVSPASRDSLTQARFLAGLTPMQGPGVVVTLRDSKMPYPGGLPTGMEPPNLIHDTDINQVVNELKASGAEAIAVNDQRLILTSAVRGIGHTIVVNNVVQAPPYIIRAIGNERRMMNAINIHGGIAAQIKSFDSHTFSAQKADTLNLPAYSGDNRPRYARPVTLASFDTDRTEALIQKRHRLNAQLSELNGQAVSLNAQLQKVQREAQQKIKKLSMPDMEMAKIEEKALAAQLAQAQRTLIQLKATKTALHPDVIDARRKIQLLENEYRQLPIKQKQRFLMEVHQYVRQQVTIINTYAGTGKNAALQLINVKKQQRYLRARINLLNTQIAGEKKS